MRRLSVVFVVLMSAGIVGSAQNSWGSTSTPTITSFTPTSGRVGTTVTITGTNLTGGNVVDFGTTATASQSALATRVTVAVPFGATTGYIRVITQAGTAKSSTEFSVKPTPSLIGVSHITSDTDGFCAVLTSGGVDCWGYGDQGELGNGTMDRSGTPVPVKGLGATGTLAGVKQLASDAHDFCALLTSGAVDCWGLNQWGELGDGSSTPSLVPVAVEGVGGTGVLSGVTSLTGGTGSFCAVLTTGGVDCWGSDVTGVQGQIFESSSTPIPVLGVSGTGVLKRVKNVTSSGGGFCALRESDTVDCWGGGGGCALGNGNFLSEIAPVPVVGTGGTGVLSGVNAVVSSSGGYCAVLASGNVDCWGNGTYGELGNGVFYTTGNYGSAVPVAVEGIGGAGTLSGVKSVTDNSSSNTYCALLSSGELACWGLGYHGELGDGTFYTTGSNGSAVPVAVVSGDGSGTLSGVKAVVDGGSGYNPCALLTSGGVDCWGYGADGELGNGTYYTSGNEGSAVPVAVISVGGTAPLVGVRIIGSGAPDDLSGVANSNCVILTSTKVDCWGYGSYGQLGNGHLYFGSPPYGSATPQRAVAVGT